MSRGIRSLAGFVRAHDRDRYQTALFAPAERREALFALYAFNYEIARVRESVTQPILGQIRLQWWRETIAAAYDGTPPRAHEVVLPLTAAIRNRAPTRACFDRLIDTRERDLGDEPPADLAALVDYAEGSSATLLYLALELLGAAEPAALAAARDVGIGYGLAGLLRALPFHARAGRCYLPAEVVRHARLDPAGMRGTTELRAAIREVAAAATAHLDTARRQTATVAPAARPALLSAVIARHSLRRLERAGWDPFAPELARRDPLQAWRLAAAALRGRF